MTTTRSRLIATLLGLVALALGLLSPYAMATRAATPDRILVYMGDGSSNPGFTNFGAAAGRPVDIGSYLLTDLSSYACILLPPKSRAFSAAEKSALAAYLAGGGRVLAMGDYATYAPEANATMTDLAASLGAGLSIVNAPVNDAKQSTSDIAASPLTIGVVRLAYGAIAAVAIAPAVNPTAQELVRAADGTPFVAAAKVGNGIFVLSGDFHVFSNWAQPRLHHPRQRDLRRGPLRHAGDQHSAVHYQEPALLPGRRGDHGDSRRHLRRPGRRPGDAERLIRDCGR